MRFPKAGSLNRGPIIASPGNEMNRTGGTPMASARGPANSGPLESPAMRSESANPISAAALELATVLEPGFSKTGLEAKLCTPPDAEPTSPTIHTNVGIIP